MLVWGRVWAKYTLFEALEPLGRVERLATIPTCKKRTSDLEGFHHGGSLTLGINVHERPHIYIGLWA